MLRNWPILLLAVALLAVIGVSCYTDPSNNAKQKSTEYIPSTARVTANQTTQTGQNAQTSERPPFWLKVFHWPDGVTALAVILTLFFIGWQAMLTRQAILLTEKSSKTELRAYLSVAINSGTYQERDKNIKFSGIPILTNIGRTPAHNVRYRTNAAILREPLPPNFSFAAGQEEIGSYALGMSQTFQITALFDDFIDSQDVNSVMTATNNRAFYYWGLIRYEDAFGDSHTTEFCHRLYFTPSGEEEWRVNGTYVPGHNKAT